MLQWGLMAFLHFKMEATTPLYIQAFMGLFLVWDWPMFRLNVLEEAPEDFPELRRPFPLPPNPLKQALKQFGFGDDEEAAPAPAAAVEDAPRVEVLPDEEEEEDKKTK